MSRVTKPFAREEATSTQHWALVHRQSLPGLVTCGWFWGNEEEILLSELHYYLMLGFLRLRAVQLKCFLPARHLWDHHNERCDVCYETAFDQQSQAGEYKYITKHNIKGDRLLNLKTSKREHRKSWRNPRLSKRKVSKRSFRNEELQFRAVFQPQLG